MSFLSSLLNGFFTACGIMVGFFVVIVWILRKVGTVPEEYDMDELRIAFEALYKSLRENEQYEYMHKVGKVIADISAHLPVDVSPYKITSKPFLYIGEKEGERTPITLGKKYIVEVKKNYKADHE